MNSLDWTPLLLSDSSSILRHLVLTELLNKSDQDSEVTSTKELRFNDTLLKPLIQQQNKDGSWNPGIIYNSDHRGIFQTTCDVLKRLGYFGFDSTFNFVSKAVDYIFQSQNDDGSWNSSLSNENESFNNSKDFIPLDTAIPLRSIIACGYAEDKRSKLAFDWLLERQLDDGAWPTGKAGGGIYRGRAGYRKLPLSKLGCRSNTTGVLTCLAYHPKLKQSNEAKRAMEHLLACQTRDRQTLGYEVSRIVGFEATTGILTYYAKIDHLLTLDLSWRIGVSKDDKKLKNIISFLMESVNKFGLLLYLPNHEASRWITFDLKRSIKNLSEEDSNWISEDFEIPFQKYSKINRRF
jgi:hypothetical protein